MYKVNSLYIFIFTCIFCALEVVNCFSIFTQLVPIGCNFFALNLFFFVFVCCVYSRIISWEDSIFQSYYRLPADKKWCFYWKKKYKSIFYYFIESFKTVVIQDLPPMFVQSVLSQFRCRNFLFRFEVKIT